MGDVQILEHVISSDLTNKFFEEVVRKTNIMIENTSDTSEPKMQTIDENAILNNRVDMNQIRPLSRLERREIMKNEKRKRKLKNKKL